MEGLPSSGGAWATEPGAVVGLVTLVALYGWGVRRSRRAGARPTPARAASFTLGWCMLVVALVSPLHAAGQDSLSAHMAQHVLVILAPLPLAAGRTGTRLLQALAPTWRGEVARRLHRWRPGRSRGRMALLLLLATILVWHLPPVFEAATERPLLHGAEHLSLVAAAAVYWSHVVGSASSRPDRIVPALASVFALFVAGAAGGALLTFSTVAWYPSYAARAAGRGIDWLADQQLAGVVMSAPMGIVLMGVAAWLAWRWAGEMEGRGRPLSPGDRPSSLSGGDGRRHSAREPVGELPSDRSQHQTGYGQENQRHPSHRE